MTTYKIQWRGPIVNGCTVGPWKDLEHEEWKLPEHAELRKSQYWEKLSFAHLLEFRVEPTPPESLPSLPVVQ